MDLVSSLNENQKNAVEHTEGPLLILAGAGSGKTRVITHRIGQLIHNNGVRPYNIFAVTFTNKAAGEMKERLISLIGPQGNSVFVKTFHAASVYILRRYGEMIGIPSAFTIYDQSDQETVLKRVLIDMRLDPKKIKPSMLASKISEIKDKASLVQGVVISSLIPDYFSFDFEEIYTQYHKELAKANALDFNDLLIKTVELLRSCPEVLERLQTQWHYFMVDEYQDTNYAQYLITKMLANHSKNICVVGDDDQSIYSWRGADIRNILDFEKDYPDAMVITLEENYRSSKEILDTAFSVIQNNINRKEKNIIAVRGEGEIPIWCQTNNEYGESEFVINTILSHKNREGLKNNDFAIFYRTNAQSRVFEDYLRKENLPYRVVGGLKFYDRKEIKDTLAYLKFTINPNDIVSLMRVINTPARGIGKASVDRINQIAKEEDIILWKVIEDELLTGRVPKGLDGFKEIMISLRKSAKNVPDSLKLSQFCT
ncbi:MAG: UvrD-helicase domain-containing protein, partial [Bacteroidales bacterium]|nr:UvrD-helicase domain-containing protein [Bacteroidales bacterium]